MDFLCLMIELALQASRDHVFAAAQQHLGETHRIPTLKTSDFGVHVNTDRYAEDIFQTSTQVVWKENVPLRVNAIQTIGMMSHGAYWTCRLHDLEFYFSSAGYDASGPGGEQVEKFYMSIKFIDGENGGHGIYIYPYLRLRHNK